jgi:hypothetical protein
MIFELVCLLINVVLYAVFIVYLMYAFVLLVWQNFNKLLKNYNAKLMSYRLEDSNEIFEGTDSVFDNESPQTFLKNSSKRRIYPITHAKFLLHVITETLIV